jgi:hypothetical protein
MKRGQATFQAMFVAVRGAQRGVQAQGGRDSGLPVGCPEGLLSIHTGAQGGECMIDEWPEAGKSSLSPFPFPIEWRFSGAAIALATVAKWPIAAINPPTLPYVLCTWREEFTPSTGSSPRD